MDFLHARVHHARLRELSAAGDSPADFAQDLVFVHCPVCGDAYFADLDPGDEPVLQDGMEWAAQAHLAGECPDHAHWFRVGG